MIFLSFDFKIYIMYRCLETVLYLAEASGIKRNRKVQALLSLPNVGFLIH